MPKDPTKFTETIKGLLSEGYTSEDIIAKVKEVKAATTDEDTTDEGAPIPSAMTPDQAVALAFEKHGVTGVD